MKILRQRTRESAAMVERTTSLDALPTELLYDIFDKLNPRDIKHLRGVTNRLRDIITPLIFKTLTVRFYDPESNNLYSPGYTRCSQHGCYDGALRPCNGEALGVTFLASLLGRNRKMSCGYYYSAAYKHLQFADEKAWRAGLGRRAPDPVCGSLGLLGGQVLHAVENIAICLHREWSSSYGSAQYGAVARFVEDVLPNILARSATPKLRAVRVMGFITSNTAELENGTLRTLARLLKAVCDLSTAHRHGIEIHISLSVACSQQLAYAPAEVIRPLSGISSLALRFPSYCKFGKEFQTQALAMLERCPALEVPEAGPDGILTRGSVSVNVPSEFGSFSVTDVRIGPLQDDWIRAHEGRRSVFRWPYRDYSTSVSH